MAENKTMKRVRIDDILIEQIDNYDLFPKGVWSRRAKVNYLLNIGLAYLLIKLERECKEHEEEDKNAEFMDQILRDQAANRLIIQAAETKIPRSELARLVHRALYECDNIE